METITSADILKKNFLELFKNLAPEDTQALLEYRKSVIIEKKIKRYCTKAYPLSKVLLIFHTYACMAFITAELKVNAKVFLDERKKDFMLVSYKKNSNPDTCSIVYSTIQDLCNYPFFPIPVSKIFTLVENNQLIDGLRSYFKTHVK